jgi:hypothetical protein
MTILQFASADLLETRRHPDLDSAFNDGYQLAPRSKKVIFLQWTIFSWCIAALLIGTAVMIGALAAAVAAAWAFAVAWVS